MTGDELASLSEKAARVLAGGGGLRALAQLLADTTQGAVLIEDDQWRHLALAEPRGGLGPLPPSFSPFFREAGVRGSASNGITRAQISDALLALCAQMPGQSDADNAPGYVDALPAGQAQPRYRPGAAGGRQRGRHRMSAPRR